MLSLNNIDKEYWPFQYRNGQGHSGITTTIAGSWHWGEIRALAEIGSDGDASHSCILAQLALQITGAIGEEG